MVPFSERKHTNNLIRTCAERNFGAREAVSRLDEKVTITMRGVSWSNYMSIWSTHGFDSRKINEWPHLGFIQRKSSRILAGEPAYVTRRKVVTHCIGNWRIKVWFYTGFRCFFTLPNCLKGDEAC